MAVAMAAAKEAKAGERERRDEGLKLLAMVDETEPVGDSG